MKERFSSLHDDVLVPKATEHLGEYKDYPERFDPKDKSVLTRLDQFGVDVEAVQNELGKEINQLSWSEYNEIIANAIKAKYDVIVGSVFDKYMFPSPEDPLTEERVRGMFDSIKQYEDMKDRCGVNLIQREADFQENGENLVLGLEAGAHLIQTMADLKKIVDANVKLFGLQYGKDTPLATSDGLTDFGLQAVKYLMDKNLIIDLAHSGFKTRQDVMDLAEDQEKGHLISYTHGSTQEDVDEAFKSKVGERLLTQSEVKRIVRLKGIIGLGVTRPFFAGTEKIAQRINEIAQLENGVKHIALGTDFGGVPQAFTDEIKSVDDLPILGDALAHNFKMNKEEIDRVLRTNAKEWIKAAIKK